ncbi:TPA: type I-E CRISPR-associated protein Cse1/CasA [Pseudomonas aeruginosa]
MTEHYNLLDTPWLPVRLANGEVREMGLLEVFREAGRISALAETEPPSLIAQYRLLLAITHRALLLEYGAWKDSGRLRWFREGLPIDVVERYLERWRERFWLFHPQYPFMQVAALASAAETCDKQKPWAQISLASANGNTPVVFDHSYDLAPSAVSADRALCALLGFLQFTPGGLVKTVRDSDKAGALANTAAVVPLADSLAKTLCLALHPASGGAAFDLPAWEREALTIPQLAADPILASGPNDRYTRQSRAVLLLPEEEGCVRWIRFAAGQALADDVQAPDPMASYRPGANNSMVRLSFGEGRVFWRDLPSLLPDSAAAGSKRAAVLDWASNLRSIGADAPSSMLLVAGLASDQAKLLRWRSETVVLPAVLLDSEGCANELRRCIRESEDLYGELRKIAVAMLAEALLDPASKDTWARARTSFDNGPAAATYFALLERSLPSLMALIGGDSLEMLDEAEAFWRSRLLAALEVAWQGVREGLGLSVAALRAEAKVRPRYLALLRRYRSEPTSSTPLAEEQRA